MIRAYSAPVYRPEAAEFRGTGDEAAFGGSVCASLPGLVPSSEEPPKCCAFFLAVLASKVTCLKLNSAAATVVAGCIHA